MRRRDPRCRRLGQHRADRLSGQVGRLPRASWRPPVTTRAAIERITCPIGDPTHHRQGAGRDRDRRRGRAGPHDSSVRRAGGHRRAGDALPGHASSTPRATRSSADPAHALRADLDGAIVVRDGVIVARGAYADAARRLPRRAGRRPHRRPAAARLRRHARPLPADPRDRRARACRCSTGSSAARCPRSAGSPTTPTPRRGPTSSWTGWCRPARRPRSCSARTSRPRWTRSSPRPQRRGLNITAGLVLSDRMLPPDLLSSPEQALRREPGADRALARPRSAALRGHPAVLAVGLGRDCSRSARELMARRRSGSPRTSTRTGPRSRRSAELFPGCPRLPRHLRPARPGRPQRSVFAHNAHPSDAELERDGRRRGLDRALPDQQLPRWAAGCSRCAATSSTGSAWRSAPTSAPAPACSCRRRALQAYFMQQLLGDGRAGR